MEENKPKREMAKGMWRKGDKRTLEDRKKQSETKKRNAGEIKQAKLVAKFILQGDNMDNMLSGIYKKAADGDVKACELMLKLVGEMPKEQKEVDLKADVKVEPVTGIQVIESSEETE